jgi:hypothetical protein
MITEGPIELHNSSFNEPIHAIGVVEVQGMANNINPSFNRLKQWGLSLLGQQCLNRAIQDISCSGRHPMAIS